MAKKHVSAQEQKSKMLRACLKKHMELCDVATIGDLAPIAGISRTTMYERWGNPSSFKWCELSRLFDELHFTADEKAACV